MFYRNAILIRLCCYSVVLATGFTAFAGQNDITPTHKDSLSSKVQDSMTAINGGFVADDPVLAMLDSLSVATFFQSSKYSAYQKSQNIGKFPDGYVPTYSDSVYAARMKKLDVKSPMKLVYNEEVKRWIDLYAVRKPMLTARVLGLSQLYFPIFEEQLDKHKLPLELKYLAVIESALNPVVVSGAGAGGLWQFMYNTGKQYNLRVNSYVDERYDPYKATIAACSYLTKLYGMYHDWLLAIAAYNCGEGNLNKAIRRAGGEKDFWKLEPYLPQETRSYVPAFIAVNYVMNYASEHNIQPVTPAYFYYEVDTVYTKQSVCFEQISKVLKIPIEDLKFLNPAYKKGMLPSIGEDRYALRLPLKYVGDFVNNETAIYAAKTQDQIEEETYIAQQQKAINRSSSSTKEIVKRHVVRSGESVGLIARKYGCSVADIKSWNKLHGSTIHPKQSLIVHKTIIKTKVETEVASSTKSSNGNDTKDSLSATTQEPTDTLATIINANIPDVKSPKYIYHTVRQGDTLWNISSRYKMLSVEELKKINKLSNTKGIVPGQKLKVGISG